MVAMGSKLKNVARKQLELPRHITVPILLLVLLTVPWLFGGREPIGHLLTAVLSLLLFLGWLVMSRHRALRVDINPPLVILPMLGLIAWAACSLIWSVSVFQSTVLLTTLFEGVLAFVVARDVMHEEEAPYFITRLWTMVAFVVWAVGIGMFAAGNYDRMTSLFYWANPLGTYLAASIIIALFIVRTSAGRAARMWSVITAALASGLILTYSRSAWLVAILALIATVALVQDKKREITRIVKIALLSMIVAYVTVSVRGAVYKQPVIDVKARVTESTTTRSVSDRFEFWRESSVLVSERPILGWGIGTFSEIHPRVQSSATTATNNPHNSVMQTLVELGYIGGIGFGIAVVGWVSVGWKLYKERSQTIAPVAWIATSVIALHSLMDLTTNYPVLILAGALWMGLALPAPTIAFRLKQWFVAVPLAIVGVASLWAVGVHWNTYTSALDLQAVDSRFGDDPGAIHDMYARIIARPLTDPDTISRSVIFAIDQFDSGTDISSDSLDSARLQAERAVKSEPQDARHVFALANVLERQGKVIEALTNYRQAITLDPHNNPQYHTAYARLLQKEGQIPEAIIVMKTILDEYSSDVIGNRSFISISQRLSVGYALLADLYIEKQDLGRAQQAIERAESLSPSNAYVQQVKSSLEAAQK